MTDYDVPRDRWGRPNLFPPDSDKREGYVRVSTLAKALDDKTGLINWKASMAMIGLMRSKALQARVSSMAARGGAVYADNKKPLAEIVEKATDLAGASGAADLGTSIHEFTEMVDDGVLDWSFVPEELKGPLDAYGSAMETITVLDKEVFGTVDAVVGGHVLRTAGSMDKILDVPGLGVIVGDVKTGANEPKFGLGCTAQVATYARAMRYRDDKFPGTPNFADGDLDLNGVSFRKPLWEGVSHDKGLMVHLPLEKVRGKYVCDLYVLDLEHGWRAIETAVQVREVKKLPKLEKLAR